MRALRSEGIARWAGAILGALGGFALGIGMVLVTKPSSGSRAIVILTTCEGLLFAFLGAPYVTGGWRRVNFKLHTTPLPDLISGILGLVTGLLVAVLIGYFVHDLPFGVPLSTGLAVLLAVTGARTGLTRRTELETLVGLRAPEASSTRRMKCAVLDTSVIIDGRILDLSRTGFLDMPLVVPLFVIRELQLVADSADTGKRNRGRRGLDILEALQREPDIELRLPHDDFPEPEVDAKLVKLARKLGGAILTNDSPLLRIARLEGIRVLNLNELSNVLKPIALPGETLTLLLSRDGKEPGQGLGYLEDGTPVIVENARPLVGNVVTVTVSRTHQTAAGRMIFAFVEGQNSTPDQARRRGRRPASA